MKTLAIFLLARVLDTMTTLAVVTRSGISSELNPFIRGVMHKIGIWPWAILNLLVSLAIGYLFVKLHRLTKLSLKIFTAINFLIILSNIVALLL